MKICSLLVQNYHQNNLLSAESQLVLAKSIANIAVFSQNVYICQELGFLEKNYFQIFHFWSGTFLKIFIKSICSKFSVECHLYTSFSQKILYRKNLGLLITKIEGEVFFSSFKAKFGYVFQHFWIWITIFKRLFPNL